MENRECHLGACISIVDGSLPCFQTVDQMYSRLFPTQVFVIIIIMISFAPEKDTTPSTIGQQPICSVKNPRGPGHA